MDFHLYYTIQILKKARLNDEPEQFTLTDEEFDKLLKECLSEEYPDMVKDQDEI